VMGDGPVVVTPITSAGEMKAVLQVRPSAHAQPQTSRSQGARLHPQLSFTALSTRHDVHMKAFPGCFVRLMTLNRRSGCLASAKPHCSRLDPQQFRIELAASRHRSHAFASGGRVAVWNPLAPLACETRDNVSRGSIGEPILNAD